MGKWLLVAVLALLAIFWLRHKALAQRAERVKASARSAVDEGEAAGAMPQKMVACARCGLNVPQPEALQGTSGNRYCGLEHLALAGDAVR